MGTITDILLVEDETSLRELLAEYLRARGYSVAEAENGRRAQEVLANLAVRLIITDVFMPDSDGLELLGKLRRSHPRLPCIAISGGALGGRDLYLKISLHMGAYRILTKPFELSELLALVQGALGARAA